jgi:TPR repeat protein
MAQSKYHKLAMFYHERNEYNELFKLLIMGCEHGCDDCVDLLMELYDAQFDRHQVFNAGQIAFYQNIWLNDKIDPNKQYRINYLGLIYANGLGVQLDLCKGCKYYHYAAMLGNVFAIANLLETKCEYYKAYNAYNYGTDGSSNIDSAIRSQMCNTFIHLVIKHRYLHNLSQKVRYIWDMMLRNTIRVETTIQLLEYWRLNHVLTFRGAISTAWDFILIHNMYKIYVYLLNIPTNTSYNSEVRTFISRYEIRKQYQVRWMIADSKHELWPRYSADRASMPLKVSTLTIDEN